jgi:hypothetical protein
MAVGHVGQAGPGRPATSAAGSGILVAMILGGSVALATGISAAQLGVNFPEESGAFSCVGTFTTGTVNVPDTVVEAEPISLGQTLYRPNDRFQTCGAMPAR